MKTSPVVITITKDLVVREASPKDAQALYRLIEEGRNYLREWLPFIDASTNVSDTKQYLKYVTSPETESDEVFCIEYQEMVVGLVGFKEIDELNKKLEIGYWLGQAYQGKGIMQQACQALIRYAFTAKNMNRIQIRVGLGNYRSSNIPKKLGFVLEGVQREGEFLNGKFHNLEVYSLLKADWNNL